VEAPRILLAPHCDRGGAVIVLDRRLDGGDVEPVMTAEARILRRDHSPHEVGGDFAQRLGVMRDVLALQRAQRHQHRARRLKETGKQHPQQRDRHQHDEQHLQQRTQPIAVLLVADTLELRIQLLDRSASPLDLDFMGIDRLPARSGFALAGVFAGF
jgi:hypothetical protein